MLVPTAAELRHASFDTLHTLLTEAPCAPWPSGVWRGSWLMPWPDRPRHAHVVNRALFDLPRYGLDLDHATWWFVHPRARVARFSVSIGPSRFLDSDIVRLEYGVSRLPRPVRALLYDEVKPLDDRLMLGLGAIDRAPGVGERFLFLLEPY